MVMVIYSYVERIGEFLLPLIFSYHIYDPKNAIHMDQLRYIYNHK